MTTAPTHPIRSLIMGSPGAGKGTQTKRITANFGFVTVSSGDLLRKNIADGTPIGKEVDSLIAKGELVPDQTVVRLVVDELGRLAGKDWMLDGFPRTLGQAQVLDKVLEEKGMPLDLVINLDVPEEVILQRIMDRWIHAPSGRTYNLSYNPPKVAGLDDVTGEPLTKRPDDNVDTFKTRLDKYHAETMPLRQYYESRGILKNFFGKTSDEIYPLIDEELREVRGKLATHGRNAYTSARQAAGVRSFSTWSRRNHLTSDLRTPTPPLAFTSRTLALARSSPSRTFTTTPLLHNTTAAADPYAEEPPRSTGNAYLNVLGKTWDFIKRFRRLIFELMLWMVAGSIAIEMKQRKRDMEEYLEGLTIQRKKLQRRIEGYQKVVEGPRREELREKLDGKVLVEDVEGEFEVFVRDVRKWMLMGFLVLQNPQILENPQILDQRSRLLCGDARDINTMLPATHFGCWSGAVMRAYRRY
ncbi:hypothetical protein HK097_003321 [Rhizophlyctis rosea]|uniref:GTP:AMP phosphotransferase, mitochondrial n=1 Tax=Rhizophlyctis rosea TaxID=64517 RepID=A0AAD5SFX4_9FUNG|nr:hypothetical protein HK097_003321 [Rhizophlyctis rosea]